jgi:hypothetical protein
MHAEAVSGGKKKRHDQQCSFHVIITSSVGLSAFMARRDSKAMALVLGEKRNEVHER